MFVSRSWLKERNNFYNRIKSDNYARRKNQEKSEHFNTSMWCWSETFYFILKIL